ncbi:MAG: GGDEF domain-containing protein [Spirochaetales bacterium]|nr:GGDEF domain-containing protein [Spirochaetales bacterium]
MDSKAYKSSNRFVFLLDLRDKLYKAPKPLLLILSLLFIGCIGYVDFITGPEYAFSLFYLIPIAFICWIRGRLFGLIAAVCAAAAWYAADMASNNEYSHQFVMIWNTLVRFTFFIIVGNLICTVNTMFRRFQSEARLDFLTGLVNVRYFYDILENEINRFKRYKQSFSIAYVDIDNFKKVNDLLGHLQGNLLLKNIAQALSASVRSSDTLARVGGDEFVLLLINSDENQAKSALGKIIKNISVVIKRNKWPVSLSVGVVTYKKLPDSPDEVIKIADDLMYDVKAAGKNNIYYKTVD